MAPQTPFPQGLRPWQRRLHDIIFEAETPAGKLFDVVLLLAIVASVIAVILESVAPIRERYGPALLAIEWGFTILFTAEYVLRLLCVARPRRYALSFFGIVDLLAILPTYASLLIPNSQELLVIRALRLLRVFRVFKLGRFIGEAEALMAGIRQSREKIVVFLTTIITSVVIMGSLMHFIEGKVNPGFSDIPHGIYWAVVTMTTVGYGDISPITVPGKFIAATMMVFGYSLLIVPTGIISAEMASGARHHNTESCPHCIKEGHAPKARFCDRCGGGLNQEHDNAG
ncbi:MAG: ion transporter [Algisphaera sp.]